MAIPATIAVVRIARFAPTPINKPPMKLGINGQIGIHRKSLANCQSDPSAFEELTSSTMRGGRQLDGVVPERPMPLEHWIDARGASPANDSDILAQ